MAVNDAQISAFKKMAISQGVDEATVDAFVTAAMAREQEKKTKKGEDIDKWVAAVNEGLDISSVPSEIRADVMIQANKSSRYTPSFQEPEIPTTPSPRTTKKTQASGPSSSLRNSSTSIPDQPAPKGKGIVGSIVDSVVSPFVNTGKNVAGAGYELFRAGKQALGDKSAYVDQETGSVVQNPFLNEQELTKVSQPLSLQKDSALRQQVADSAGVASWAVPFGKGANIATKALLPGATVGALQSVRPGLDIGQVPGEVVKGAASGAAGAGLLHGAGKLVEKAGKSVPKTLMNKVFKESGKETKTAIKAGETLGEKVSKKGVKGITDDSIYKNSVLVIENLENQLQEKLSSSTRIIPMADLKQALKPLIKKYTNSGNTSAVNSITERLTALEQAHGKSVPVSVANEVKRTLYEEARNGYGQLASERIEGTKAIAKALKEAIASKVKGVGNINEELSYQGRVADSILNKMKSEAGKGSLGLSDMILGGAGIVGAVPSGGVSLIPAIANKLYGSTTGKMILSKGFQGAGNAIEKASSSPGLNLIGGQSASRAGLGIKNLISPQVFPEVSSDQGADNNYDGNDKDLLESHISPSVSSEEVTPYDNENGQADPEQGASGNVDEHNGNIVPQTEENAIETLNPYGATPKQLYSEYQNAFKAGDKKTADHLYQMYKDEVAWHKENKVKGEDVPVGVATKRELGNSGMRAFKQIERLLADDPGKVLKAALPGQIGARDYDAAAFKSVEGLLRARSGAAVPEEEVRRYMRANLPRVGDSPEEIQFKLDLFRQDLEAMVEFNAGTDGDMLIEELSGQGGGGLGLNLGTNPVQDKMTTIASEYGIGDEINNQAVISKAAEVLLKSGEDINSPGGKKVLSDYFKAVEKALDQKARQGASQTQKKHLGLIIESAKAPTSKPGLGLGGGSQHFLYR